ncbi:anthocyanidin 3-O-glucosyltransferase 2-like isoform X2 [Salvia hispanica]|uniref:anthocyanidin 3-O-glucosyltransferase 2-like isoform X1 n=1 Tax=Salvia hispanica TaxID=49212 RepID=UPI0020093A9F|nr:anthocyanidin 3-O-glucosyltransferase 2-like isoform X1 [Salvia hispanica]XP_047971725.1 anthocyanidin 3-O-glucosyltransferase 2-like isoform X2 [Salvia hispanica]
MEVVLIPWPLMGHVQIVEFAKLIIHRQNLLPLPPGKTLSVTVLLMKLPDYIDSVSSSYADLLSSSSTSSVHLNFVHLSATEPTPEWSARTRGYFVHSLVVSQQPNVAEFLRSRRPNVAAMVVDMLCTSMIGVAAELAIPAYIFFTSPASFLGAMLHFQTLHDERNDDVCALQDSGSELDIPSFGLPLPPSVLSQVLVVRSQWEDRFLQYARDYRKARGIIVNTFAELEPHALGSFVMGSAYGAAPVPPVYSVGPILNCGPSHKSSPEVLKWLDEQHSGSVVLICFGSQGSLSEVQIRELAIGLEQSGQRFLWSLRRQAPSSQKASFPGEYESYREVLPEGFLDRTSGVGKVVGWIPQLEVLSHPAVGGFVSHCGWNSVLESLWCGVPVATWPLHSEQQMNAFQLVRELGLAVEITLSYLERSGDGSVVAAAEVERGIREVMESGSRVKERVREMKEKSRMTVVEGGSSYASFKRLIDDMMSNASTS